MSMPATQWTVEMVRALPADRERFEIIDGELFVTPGPTWSHQRAVRDLLFRIADYLRASPELEALFAPADITAGERTLVQPDVFVMPRGPGAMPGGWVDVGALVLAVEVLSPSTARADRHRKRRLYQRERVPEYWIVDVDARLIERWRPDDERPEILAEHLEWHPDPAHPPLIVDLPAYFRDVTED